MCNINLDLGLDFCSGYILFKLYETIIPKKTYKEPNKLT